MKTNPRDCDSAATLAGSSASRGPSSWAAVVAARTAPSSHASSASVAVPFVAPKSFNVPAPLSPPGSRPLTLAAAEAFLRSPTSATPGALAAARSLLTGIGTPLPLDPRIGTPTPPPLPITALAFAHSTNQAFNTFEAAQRVLRAGSQRAGVPLRPHVLLPGVGLWTAIYWRSHALMNPP